MVISAVAVLHKLDDEERLIAGPVLIPDTFDTQDDIATPLEIRKAAHRFLLRLNEETRMGIMHKSFPDGVRLVESYVVPEGNTITLGADTYQPGTWLIVVKVLDDEIWSRVQEGELTAFSVGDGQATAYPVDDEAKAALAALKDAT